MNKTAVLFLAVVLTMNSLPALAQEPFRMSGHLAGEMIQDGHTIKISVNLPGPSSCKSDRGTRVR